jgi:hypothetical protein
MGEIPEKMKLLSSETIDELDETITNTIKGIPKRILIGLFHSRRQRFE